MDAPSTAVGLEEKKIVETVDLSCRACPFDQPPVDANFRSTTQVIELATSARIAPREVDPATATVARSGSSQQAFCQNAGFPHGCRLARRRSLPPPDRSPGRTSATLRPPTARGLRTLRSAGHPLYRPGLRSLRPGHIQPPPLPAIRQRPLRSAVDGFPGP